MFPYRRKGQFKDMRAQFFTPHNVAECMAKMSLMDAEVMCIERLKQAVEGDPLAEALTLMTTAFPEEGERFFFERLLPYAVDRAQPFTVADICCGSGVMLLAAARQFPRWAIDSGLVQFYGVDIDPLCVEMCRLNMRLYGIEPLALRPVDALPLAELKALPWPYGELYARAVTDAPPGRAHWEEGVDFARAQYAEHHQRLFEERVTRAEALARGLGLQRLTVGPIEWWFDDGGSFCWRRLETPQVDGWEQGRLPGCDIDNE